MKYLHECPEWDFMIISELDDEISCCSCFYEEEFIKIRQEKQNEQEEYRMNCG